MKTKATSINLNIISFVAIAPIGLLCTFAIIGALWNATI
jgi:hypothetical protein